MNAGVALTCTKCACAQFIPQMWSSNKCMTCFHAVTSHAREGDAKRVAPPDALLQRSMIRNSLQRQQSVQVLRSPISQPQPQQQPQQQQQVVIAPPGSPKPPLPVKKKRGLPINTNVNVNATSRDSSSSPSPPPPPEENTQHTEVPGTPPSPPPGTPPLPDRVYDRVPNVLPPLPTKGAAAAAAAGATTTTSPRPKPLPKLPPTTVSPRRAEFGTIYSPYTPLEVTAPIELQTALTTDVLRDYRRSLHLFSGTLPAQYRELGESDSKLVGSELLSTLLLTAGVDAENAEGLMDVVVLPHVQQVPRVLPPAQLAAMRTLVGDLREYARAQRVLRGVTLLQARVRGMLVRRRLARVTRGSREQLRRCTAAYSVLLRTETTFVTDLSTLVNEYVLPLRNLQWA
jgi:hypothetical protein